MMVSLTMGDTDTARAAGVDFACTLSGARTQDFAMALAEQQHLIQRTIIDAGFTALQAGLVAREFTTSASIEWQRIAGAGSSTDWGRA